MRLGALYGQTVVKEQLRRALVDGRVAHAYLFFGPAGVGKKTAALAWAQALNCTEPRAGEACERCPACLKIRARSHPDLLWIEPSGASLRLEQLQEVRRRALHGPYEGRYLVVALVQAELLTPEAANALLKLLEEPGERIVFVLVSDRAQDLLPTVRSRCQAVRFRPLPRPVLARFLVEQGLGEPQAQRLAALAGGSLERAKALAAGSFPQELVREVWSLLWEGSVRRRLEWAERFKDQDGREWLELFLDWTRDVWVWLKTGRSDLLHDPELPDRLPANLPPPRELAALGRRILQARRALEQNAQKQLLWEVVFLGWPRAAASEGRTRGGKSSRGPVP
ncbi:MAG: DNA polymerase III subunit delta' [Moorellales bacterium]